VGFFGIGVVAVPVPVYKDRALRWAHSNISIYD